LEKKFSTALSQEAEVIAERKVRRRQLTDEGNVEITDRDLRERPGASGSL
jgi:hypothetical protein